MKRFETSQSKTINFVDYMKLLSQAKVENLYVNNLSID